MYVPKYFNRYICHVFVHVKGKLSDYVSARRQGKLWKIQTLFLEMSTITSFTNLLHWKFNGHQLTIHTPDTHARIYTRWKEKRFEFFSFLSNALALLYCIIYFLSDLEQVSRRLYIKYKCVWVWYIHTI